MPEAKEEGKHLWNGCGSEAGKGERKRTAKPSTGTRKEGMRDQAGEKGETEEARAEAGTGEATVRRNREEKERKKQRLSSEMLKRKRTDGNGRKRKSGTGPGGKDRKGITCGTAAGAKQGRTKGNVQESRVLRTGRERMRDQAGRNGEAEEARAETGTGEAAERRNREEKERKKRELE